MRDLESDVALINFMINKILDRIAISTHLNNTGTENYNLILSVDVSYRHPYEFRYRQANAQ